MLILASLCNYLEELLQSQNISDYCPNGLQVEGKKEIRKIAFAVSASLKTIEAAVQEKADALVVHHGLFWKNGCQRVQGVQRKKLALLLENEISLLAYHLPLDLHQEYGNNWKAAKDLKWQNLKPFGLHNGLEIGVEGSFNSISIEDFQKSLESYYQCKPHKALGGKKLIESAAIVSGGSYRSIEEAAQKGIDCFISGNFDEPAWNIAHEEGLHFFAVGHYASETVGPKALANVVAKEQKIETKYLDLPNPF